MLAHGVGWVGREAAEECLEEGVVQRTVTKQLPERRVIGQCRLQLHHIEGHVGARLHEDVVKRQRVDATRVEESGVEASPGGANNGDVPVAEVTWLDESRRRGGEGEVVGVLEGRRDDDGVEEGGGDCG